MTMLGKDPTTYTDLHLCQLEKGRKSEYIIMMVASRRVLFSPVTLVIVVFAG